MSVRLSVIYAFGQSMTKCSEILQRIPFRPGEGHRIVFDPKFSPEGGVCPSYCWITTVSAFFRKSVRVIVSSIIQERKYIKTCTFYHWAQDILGYSKKNE